jgi:hypothetical protein
VWMWMSGCRCLERGWRLSLVQAANERSARTGLFGGDPVPIFGVPPSTGGTRQLALELIEPEVPLAEELPSNDTETHRKYLGNDQSRSPDSCCLMSLLFLVLPSK